MTKVPCPYCQGNFILYWEQREFWADRPVLCGHCKGQFGAVDDYRIIKMNPHSIHDEWVASRFPPIESI